MALLFIHVNALGVPLLSYGVNKRKTQTSNTLYVMKQRYT